MDDPKKLQESVSLISKHFGISQSELTDENMLPLSDDLIKRLTRVVTYLLDHDFERLINGLYRIDVDEKKVSEVLNSNNPAADIARLIFQRELQKVETRWKYNNRT